MLFGATIGIFNAIFLIFCSKRLRDTAVKSKGYSSFAAYDCTKGNPEPILQIKKDTDEYNIKEEIIQLMPFVSWILTLYLLGVKGFVLYFFGFLMIIAAKNILTKSTKT